MRMLASWAPVSAVLIWAVAGVDAQWWASDQGSATNAFQTCPGGATIQFVQVWSGGFKAALRVSEWVAGRRVVLHLDDGVERAFMRPVGAEIVESDAFHA
eukprot:4831100-Pleurochrysis_carterae.AAC.1